jgi:archaellum component FlaC
VATAFDPRLRLKPPLRGDFLAGSLLLLAFALFLGSTAAFWKLGLIEWSRVNPLLRTLSVFSFVLTTVAFLWSFMKDWRWLHAEERDIHLVLNTDEGRQDPTRALHSDHDTRAERRVETLLDDRVTRVLAPSGEEGQAPPAVRESELRAVAAWRSAGVGSFARYASGLLLLLTVLGTFIGVKSSLGPLIDALQDAATRGTTSSADLAGSLDNIASAFGSNLTALIGAIALGLGAYALTSGRQTMLARLEQASSLYIYPRAKRAAVRDEFSRALDSLAAASKDLGGVTAQLESFGDTISDLSTTVSDSLDDTRRTLKALLEQQSGQVAEQARQSVDKIERQITDVVTAVQHTTTVYDTLVSSLEAGRVEMSGTSQQLGAAVTELRKAREEFGRYADSATQTLNDRLTKIGQSIERLEGTFDRQSRVTRRTYRRYRSIDAGVGALAARAEVLAAKIEEAEQQRREAHHALEQQVLEQVARHIANEVGAQVGRQVAAPVGEVRDAVRALNAGVDGLSERVGVAVGRAVDDTVARLMAAAASPRPNGGDESIAPALYRLAQTLEGMEQRRARPLWRRILGRGGSDGRS